MCFRKKAVLFIHGFVGGIYDFGNFNNELELKRKFDVYVFTLPGHEKTIVANVTHDEWIKEAEKQIEILIKNNYKNIYVIGHSMGGVIAAHLASKYKEVKKLVLAAPAFRYVNFKDDKVDIKGISETMKSMPELFKQMKPSMFIERLAKTPIPTLIEFTKLVSSCHDDLDNITCPTLTIHGNKDTVVPQEGTDLVYNRVKSTTNILVNIDNVNHACFTGKRQEEVKSTITNFLLKKPKKKKETINI